MAERRMFAKTIIDSDAFLDMPLSTQSLYFHLSMRADDEGFINNPKKIQRMIGSSEDDLRLLIAKKFILTFDSGVIVIKHWKLHNYIRSDRFKPTLYQDEKQQLEVNDTNSYTLGMTSGIPSADQMDTQVRLGKDRLGKDKEYIVEQELDHAQSDSYKLIIDYLNNKANTKFKATTKVTKSHISARFKEGFTIDDFYKVIDNKVAEWLYNSEMSQYLRPKTLFGTNFESYLNQKKVVSSKNFKPNNRQETVPEWVDKKREEKPMSDVADKELNDRIKRLRDKKNGHK